MREKLNDNPMAQVGLIGLLVVVAAFMLLKPGGGKGEAETSSGETIATVNGVTATGDTPGEAVEGAVEGLEAGGSAGGATSAAVPSSVPVPPLPRQVSSAYDSGQTVVLLIVHDGNVDRSLARAARNHAANVPGTSLFVVPVGEIARYAAITIGVDLNRVPAMVVMRPQDISQGTPEATVDYGFQTPQSVIQAIRDASYKGPEATYHPD